MIIDTRPASLFGSVLKSSKVVKKYQSGKISSGVTNGFSGSSFPGGIGGDEGRDSSQKMVKNEG